jgi:type I restriction enzyme M protein
VRGSVDGWDFKQYVLGTLFYRFISENFALYIEAGDDSIHYVALSDEVITPDIKDDAIKTKGYFIYPSQLFANVAKNANSNESLNTDLAATFAAIETSASGYPSEGDIKGLFADFDTTSNRLGNTVKDKNGRLAAVLKGVKAFNGGHLGNKGFILMKACLIHQGRYTTLTGQRIHPLKLGLYIGHLAISELV